MTMTRRLGRSGLETSALGLGCWAIGGPYTNQEGNPCGWSEVDDDESIRAVRRALDLGVTFFDTAACYGAGHSEEVLGRALGDRRDDVLIATKFWHRFDEDRRLVLDPCERPDEVRDCLEGSLRRLGTDRIDLYQFHQGNYPADQAAPIRDVLEDLVAEGKIRFYGWSTDDHERAAVFAEGPHCTATQHRLNVFQGNLETLKLCEERDLASINKGPLIKGLLTGKFSHDSTFPDDDVRRPYWNLKDGEEGEMLDRLQPLKDVLTRRGHTLAQAALAWIWAKSPVTIPIPGFKTVEQVEENAGAMGLGPLDADQMRDIDRLLAGE